MNDAQAATIANWKGSQPDLPATFTGKFLLADTTLTEDAHAAHVPKADYASPLVYNRGNPAVPTYEPFRPDRGRRKIQGLPRPHQKRGITVNVEGL